MALDMLERRRLAARVAAAYTFPWAYQVASLDLNLLSAPLDPRITFTRASTATYFDATGTTQTAAANTPRFDYDPVTLQPRGLLIEEQRTNLLLNSATLGTQSATVTAAATTLSFYGTGSVTLSGTFSGVVNGSGATTRTVSTFTPTTGTLTLTVSGSVTNAQLETGAFVTSYIPTAGATVTRAAESAILTSAPLFTGSGGKTIAVEAYGLQVAASGTNVVWLSLDDGTASNEMQLLSPQTSSNARSIIIVGGATQINGSDGATGSRPNIFKAAIANGTVNWNSAVNGVLTAGSGGASTVLPSLSRMSIGTGGIAPINGYVRRARYWNRALSPSELQQVTT